jgi:dipeptidyl aminopeptidase/acylaminoacyl peptidase
MRYFSGDQASPEVWPSSGEPQTVIRSPNGRFVYFIYHKGRLAADDNEYTIEVFSIGALRHLLAEEHKPVRVATPIVLRDFLSKSSKEAAIRDVKWSDDSSAITFRSEDEAGATQIFSLDVPSGIVTQLTFLATGVESYESGGGAFFVRPRRSPLATFESNYPFYAFQVNDAGLAISPLRRSGELPSFVVYGGKTSKISTPLYDISIAPGGRHAVATKANESDRRPFVAVDMRTGLISDILSTPMGAATDNSGGADNGFVTPLPAPSTLWYPSGQKVLLINTTVPGKRGNFIVDVSIGVNGNRWSIVSPMDDQHGRVKSVEWINPGNLLELTYYGSEHSPRVLSRRGDGLWADAMAGSRHQAEAPSAGAVENIDIAIEQNGATPPRIVAKWRGKELALTSVDPAIENIWFGKPRTIEWLEPGPTVAAGGLLLPRSVSGPPPLVIQLYGYRPDLFLPDGLHAADAAQLLLSKGIAVLLLPITDDPDHLISGQEGPQVVARIDAAVSQLASQGIIDRTRVAISGFSRGGYEALYVLTHQGKTRFSAAACIDSFTGGFREYLERTATLPRTYPTVREFEYMPRGSFWESKNAWLEYDSIFNADKIEAPVLFSGHGFELFDPKFNSSEIIGALRRTSRPFEYLIFPDGEHNLLRPRERGNEMMQIVDWFDYWLQGRERVDPVSVIGETNEMLVDKYRRWNRIKKTWQAQRDWELRGHPVGSNPL